MIKIIVYLGISLYCHFPLRLNCVISLIVITPVFFFYLFILHSGSVNGFMRIIFSKGFWNMIIIWFRSKTSQFNTMALVSTSIIWSVYQVHKIKYLYACVCTAKKKHNKIWQILVPLISFLRKRKTVYDSYCV